MRHAFAAIIWPRRKLVLLGLFLIGVNRLSGLVLPGSSKYLIDNVIVEKDTSLLKVLLLVVGLAILVQSVTSFLLTRLLSVEAQHLIATLRAQMQKQIIQLPIAFFDDNKSGALVSRIMRDVEGVRNLVGTGLIPPGTPWLQLACVLLCIVAGLTLARRGLERGRSLPRW